MYYYQLKHDPSGRIVRKRESVAGKENEWGYVYDNEGRLAEAKLDGRLVCQCSYDKQGRRSRDYFPHTAGSQMRSYRYTTDNRLMQAGNNGYTHNKQGARILWNNAGKYTAYDYSADYLLLSAQKENDGEMFEYCYDDKGMRVGKKCNGVLVETYSWLDFIRLSGFSDGKFGYDFVYEEGVRTPYGLRRSDGAVALLYYDQIGSLRVVADVNGNVIKDILYDPFGGVINDTNPGFRIPIGFGGGLHDRDLGFVRFGWRDYDTFTGRWTSPDPMGDAAGDDDWYGYCFDDPVNLIDPLGLVALGGFGLAAVGAGMALAPHATRAAAAARTYGPAVAKVAKSIQKAVSNFAYGPVGRAFGNNADKIDDALSDRPTGTSANVMSTVAQNTPAYTKEGIEKSKELQEKALKDQIEKEEKAPRSTPDNRLRDTFGGDPVVDPNALKSVTGLEMPDVVSGRWDPLGSKANTLFDRKENVKDKNKNPYEPEVEDKKGKRGSPDRTRDKNGGGVDSTAPDSKSPDTVSSYGWGFGVGGYSYDGGKWESDHDASDTSTSRTSSSSKSTIGHGNGGWGFGTGGYGYDGKSW